MGEPARRSRRAPPRGEAAYPLSEGLVALGEPRAAVDLLRREVNLARGDGESPSPELVRLLLRYAAILESTDALAEAEFVHAESLQVVGALELEGRDAAEAFLRSGMLSVKLHDYHDAIKRLREAVRRIDLLELDELERAIMLGQAWRGQAQALEELGMFEQASDALDTLLRVKRELRFLVFSGR